MTCAWALKKPEEVEPAPLQLLLLPSVFDKQSLLQACEQTANPAICVPFTSVNTFCASGFDRLPGGHVPDNTGWQLSPKELNHLKLEKGLDIPPMPGDIFSQEEPWMRSLKTK